MASSSRRRDQSQVQIRPILHTAVLVSSVITFLLVQWEVPDPYLDEIFHIPQTQSYCNEDFESWDPAITTPPGLYLLSAIPLMTLHIPCKTPLLRGTNLLFSSIIIPALISFYLDLQARRRCKAVWRHLVFPDTQALVISSFPLIFFFGNLYYTDVASLAGVLGCLVLTAAGRHWWAVLIGVWSMTVRQTNIIWVAFSLATYLLDFAAKAQAKQQKDAGTPTTDIDPLLKDLRTPSQVIQAASMTVNTLWTSRVQVQQIVLPYLVPFGGFLVFLKWNGGIVLGHKDQHEAVLHLPQMLYLVAFTTVMLLPTLLAVGIEPAIRGSIKLGLSTPRRIVASAVTLIIMWEIVHNFTIYHPFLLADNRHYVFYILRKVFIPYRASKYLATPLYLSASWAWLWRLRRSATILWTLGFVACSAIVLVPSPLIEPRYFLIPTILLRLKLAANESLTNSTELLVAEYGYYTLINLATVGLFLMRKFRWEGWEGWMRFMW